MIKQYRLRRSILERVFGVRNNIENVVSPEQRFGQDSEIELGAFEPAPLSSEHSMYGNQQVGLVSNIQEGTIRLPHKIQMTCEVFPNSVVLVVVDFCHNEGTD